MKKTLLLIITVFISSISLFAGGVERYDHVEIDFFEQTHNFYYHAIDDTIKYLNDKGKEKHQEATVNIAFYDIDNDSTFNIFDDSFNEKIVAFFYESRYVDSLKKIEFIESGAYYRSDRIMNNTNVSRKDISDLIFIITYSFQSNKYTMWTCSKEGKNLENFTEFNYLNDYRVDVFNKTVLSFSHVSKKLIVDKKKY